MFILASIDVGVDIFENFWRIVASNSIYTFGLVTAQFIYTPKESARGKFLLRVVCCTAGLIVLIFLMSLTDNLQTAYFNDMPLISSHVLTITASACLWICYKTSAARLVYSAIAGLMLTLIYMQPAKLVQEIFGLDYNPPIILLIKLVSCICIYLLLYAIFIRKVIADKDFRPRRGQIASLVVIAVCVLLSTLLEPAVSESSLFAYIFLLVGQTVLSLGVLITQYYEYLSYEKDKAMAIELELKRTEEDQFEKYKQIVDAMNIKYHDMKHQIRELEGKKTVPQEVLDELNKTAEIYDSFVKTGNTTLDTVITEKSLICRSQGIQLTCMLDGKGLGYISVYDVNSLFGNALDNAIEYLEGVPEEDRYIAITCRRIENMLQICISNYTKGRVKLDSDGLPVTSKDRLYHGFGMKSMRQTAEKYGGNLTVITREHEFTLNILLPYKI